ncbi:MAG: anaerobic ribonucleoside-triphosphate reductase, partial [Promethearchaeota archaeon]
FNIIEEIIKMKTPYLINLCSNWLNNEIEEQYSKDGYHNYGTLQNISLNLPRYAYLSKDEDKFFEVLRNKINICSGILIKKFEIIKKRLKSNHLPLCSSTLNNQQPLFKLEDQNLALNFVGLNETVKFLTDYELHEQSEAFNFGKKIVKKIKEICSEMSEKDKKRYTLQENVSNKVIYRFAQLDLKHFPKFAIPQISKKGSHYTNFTQFRESIKMNLYEMLYRQGKFNEIIQNNRVISRISLKNIKKKSHQELKEFIKKVCINSKIACLKFYS